MLCYPESGETKVLHFLAFMVRFWEGFGAPSLRWHLFGWICFGVLCGFLHRSKGEFFPLLSGSAFLSSLSFLLLFWVPAWVLSLFFSSCVCRTTVAGRQAGLALLLLFFSFCLLFLPGSAPPFPPSFFLLFLFLSLSLSLSLFLSSLLSLSLSLSLSCMHVLH